MKVKELIKELSKQNPEAEVIGKQGKHYNEDQVYFSIDLIKPMDIVLYEEDNDFWEEAAHGYGRPAVLLGS